MNNDDKVIGKIFFESAPVMNNMLSVERINDNVVRMKCILQDADVPNRNNRVYPKTVLQNALRAPFITEKLETNSLAGEMNHPPPGSSLQRQMTIDMSNISHFIREFYWDKNLLIGVVDTSANTVGKDFGGMIVDNNMVCSYSMRGGGDVMAKGGYDYVKDPLKIITYDAAHFPSHKKAYMIQKLSESTDIDVNVTMLNNYIAENSSNTGIVLESMECFKNNVNLSIDNNKIIIADKDNKILGFSIMERKLEQEYSNILQELNMNNF